MTRPVVTEQVNVAERGEYYPDIPLFLTIIPFINAVNYYLTYSSWDNSFASKANL